MANAVKRVLLVEDNEDSRGFLAYALTSAGYVVDEAANGKQALELLVSEGQPEPSVILLDLDMPVMSGWEFLAITRRYVRLGRIPVVIVSGSQQAAQDEALRHGAVNAHLQKPIDPDEVVRLVRRMVEGGDDARTTRTSVAAEPGPRASQLAPVDGVMAAAAPADGRDEPAS